MRTYARLAGARIPAALLSGAAVLRHQPHAGQGVVGSLAALRRRRSYCSASSSSPRERMRIEELNAMVGMVRGRLGR